MRRSERVLRAAVAACASTGLALAFHVAAGAPLPRPEGIVIPLVIAFVVCAQLSGEAMSRWRLALGVAGSQLAFHLLFSLGSGGHLVASGGVHALHDPGTLRLAAEAAGTHHHGALMTVSHLLAAALTYVLLRRADVLLAWASRILSDLVARLGLRTPYVAAHAARAHAVRRSVTTRNRPLSSPRVVRGPPFSLA